MQPVSTAQPPVHCENTFMQQPVRSQRAILSDRTASKPLIIYNDDTWSLRSVDQPHTEEAITRPLRHFAGTQVGALCWCMFAGDVAYAWPSKAVESYYGRVEAWRQ